MKILAKALSVFINLANYGVGIAVTLILVFKWDYVSIFYINGMTSNECLFFNMVLFQAGLALMGLIVCLLSNEYNPQKIQTQFPTLFILLPILIGAVCIFYGLAGDTVMEKAIVSACAVIYIVLSFAIITAGSKIFQLYPKSK